MSSRDDAAVPAWRQGGAQAVAEANAIDLAITSHMQTQQRLPLGPKRVAIYARFSSERQRERSIERQLELCRERIARCGFVEVAVYADRGRSGLAMAGRHELHRALGDAKASAFDIFMVEDVDRIARVEGDAFFIRDSLEGVEIAIHDIGGELRDLIYAVKVILAAEDYKRIKRRVSLGRRRMVEEGESPHKLKFGLLRSSKGILVPHPGRKTAVVEIFSRYARGVSRSRIARDLTGRYPTPGDCYLIDAGKAPATRRSEWTGGMAREILKGTVYAGLLLDGKTKNVYDSHRRKVGVSPRRQEDWTRGDVPHSRIVDDVTWLACHARLKGERRLAVGTSGGRPGRPAKGPVASSYLLHNLISCACCNGRAIFVHSRRREWTTVRCGAA